MGPVHSWAKPIWAKLSSRGKDLCCEAEREHAHCEFTVLPLLGFCSPVSDTAAIDGRHSGTADRHLLPRRSMLCTCQGWQLRMAKQESPLGRPRRASSCVVSRVARGYGTGCASSTAEADDCSARRVRSAIVRCVALAHLPPRVPRQHSCTCPPAPLGPQVHCSTTQPGDGLGAAGCASCELVSLVNRNSVGSARCIRIGSASRPRRGRAAQENTAV
jgi:hypothetical protein